MSVDDAHPILAELPSEAQGTFARLMERTVRSPDAMREQIPHYVQAIERAAQAGHGPPASLGHSIAADCVALLDAWDTVDASAHRMIRAAVEYFLLSRDGDDDLATPEGLDDDAAVVQAVRRFLKR